MRVRSLGQEDPLEEGMATHSNSCLENPMDRGVWQATVHRIAQSQTGLKRLSNASTQKIKRCHIQGRRMASVNMLR